MVSLGERRSYPQESKSSCEVVSMKRRVVLGLIEGAQNKGAGAKIAIGGVLGLFRAQIPNSGISKYRRCERYNIKGYIDSP